MSGTEDTTKVKAVPAMRGCRSVTSQRDGGELKFDKLHQAIAGDIGIGACMDRAGQAQKGHIAPTLSKDITQYESSLDAD